MRLMMEEYELHAQQKKKFGVEAAEILSSMSGERYPTRFKKKSGAGGDVTKGNVLCLHVCVHMTTYVCSHMPTDDETAEDKGVAGYVEADDAPGAVIDPVCNRFIIITKKQQ